MKNTKNCEVNYVLYCVSAGTQEKKSFFLVDNLCPNSFISFLTTAQKEL